MLFLVSFFFQLFFKACLSSRSFRMRTTNNSLSTMSSPVTASSPSSSGSSPAPTVNTPASLPSQPVSLPDTSALAQAISRALAESLPPLIPSLREMAGTQTWPRRLFLSPRLRLLCSLQHPPAPVPPALPLSLQVRLLCPHLFERTAHLAVFRLSLLFPPRPPPTCL